MHNCIIYHLRFVVITVALLTANYAVAYEWDISPWGEPQVSPAPVTLKFAGLWPDTCIPRIVNTRLVGETLELRTLSEPGGCLQSETLFSTPIQLRPESNGASSIAWLHRRENESEFQLYGYRLRDPGSNLMIEPSSGWWWPEPGGPEDSGGPGMGITIDFQQGLLTILSQAYDPLGNPEWQLATGALTGEIFNAPLIRFSNGQTLTGDYRLPDLITGRDELSLYFHSPLSATAWFSHRRGGSLDSPIELRAVSVIRYIVNPPVLERLLTGRWLVTTQQAASDEPAVAVVQILAIAAIGPEEIQLSGPGGQTIGHCQLEPGRPEAAPSQCVLTGLNDYGDLSIHSVGYDRMAGEDQYGRAVLAVRVPR